MPASKAELNISADTVQFLIDKAHAFQVLGDSPLEDAGGYRDPTYDELKSTIDDLEPDQQVNLVGLMWLGRGDYSLDEWDRALADAGNSWNKRTAEYLIGTPMLADYLSEGLQRLSSAPVKKRND